VRPTGNRNGKMCRRAVTNRSEARRRNPTENETRRENQRERHDEMSKREHGSGVLLAKMSGHANPRPRGSLSTQDAGMKSTSSRENAEATVLCGLSGTRDTRAEILIEE
jgi:hypothetical protein